MEVRNQGVIKMVNFGRLDGWRFLYIKKLIVTNFIFTFYAQKKVDFCKQRKTHEECASG